MRAHGRDPAGRRASERRRVVLDRGAGLGEPHRQVTQRHPHRSSPCAIFEPFGHVLGEPEIVQRVRASLEPHVELGLSEVEIELLAQPEPLRQRRQCPRGDAELRLRMVTAPVDRGQRSAFDGEPGRVDRVPRRRRARQRRRKFSRTVELAGLAVGAQEANGEGRIGPRAPGEHGLQPVREKRPFVRSRKPVEERRARCNGDGLAWSKGRRPAAWVQRRRQRRRTWRRHRSSRG